MHTRPVFWMVLVVLSVSGLANACSGHDETPLTPDEAVSSLMTQGFSEEGAQCVIDGVQAQNVDIYSFLAKAKVSEHELDVMSTVGAFCARSFGLEGTTLPPASTG